MSFICFRKFYCGPQQWYIDVRVKKTRTGVPGTPPVIVKTVEINCVPTQCEKYVKFGLKYRAGNRPGILAFFLQVRNIDHPVCQIGVGGTCHETHSLHGEIYYAPCQLTKNVLKQHNAFYLIDLLFAARLQSKISHPQA